MSPIDKKDQAPADVLRRLLSSASMYAFTTVSGMSDMNDEAQAIVIFDNLKGNPASDTASIVRQLVKGEVPFARLYEQRPTNLGYDLVLREEFHQTKKYLAADWFHSGWAILLHR